MKNLISGLGTITGIATIVTVGLVAAGHPTIAAIIGAGAFFSWLALLVVSVVGVTTWWSANLMERGAELALRSQESDDRRDAALLRTLSTIARQRQQAALPMLPQSGEWLPPLSELEVQDDGP